MEEKIGALWLKKDKNGQDFFSGIIGGKSVLVFKNKYKEANNHPDYLVYPGQDKIPKKKDPGNEIPF